MKAYLTVEQAMSVLPDGDYVHTFMQSSIGLIGTDWKREELDKKLCADNIIELAGETARGMHHGIAVYNDKAKYMSDLLFIETDEEKLKALEAQFPEAADENC